MGFNVLKCWQKMLVNRFLLLLSLPGDLSLDMVDAIMLGLFPI